MTEKTFAERLLEHRSDLGLSQEDVGRKLGVSSQTISNWEAGTVPRRARITQVETWMRDGVAPAAEPMTLGAGRLIVPVPESEEVTRLRTQAASLRKKELEEANMQRRADRKAVRDAELAVFRQDLTDPLRQYAQPTPIAYNHIRFVRDYLSPYVSANLVFVSGPMASFDLPTLDLVALKKLDTDKGEKRMFYVLIVIGAAPETQAKEITLTTIASILGVGIHFVPDANAAAAVIVGLEDIAEAL